MWKPRIDVNALPAGIAGRVVPEAQASIDLGNHASFVNDTQRYFQAQRRLARAAGESIDFGVEDLRQLVRNHLGDRHCYFCRGAITPGNFGVVFRIPPERGGGYGFHNLEVVCFPCSQTKGSLDRIEFRELFELLRSWSPFVRRYFLDRLRTGIGRTDLLFPRPNHTIPATEDMTSSPPPDHERPTATD